MKTKNNKENNGNIFGAILSFLLFFILINYCMYAFYDSDDRRLEYQADSIALFKDLQEFQLDLKNETKLDTQLNSFEFAAKAKTYFNSKMVSNFRNEGEYVTMTSNTQMLCFAINQLVAGNEIDLRTYEKQYLGVINNQRKDDLGCQEYPNEPWYVIYIKNE